MKKNIFIFLRTLGISCILLLYSCDEKEICNFPAQDAGFSFRLVDQFGGKLIAKWGSRYLSDSVFVTKLDGTSPNQLYIGGGGDISFYIPDYDNLTLDTQILQQFLLYLPNPQGHPKDDIDTITFKYRFKVKEEVICHEQLHIMFNDSTYYDGVYIDFITFTKK
jgi:hypothetical protein